MAVEGVSVPRQAELTDGPRSNGDSNVVRKRLQLPNVTDFIVDVPNPVMVNDGNRSAHTVGKVNGTQSQEDLKKKFAPPKESSDLFKDKGFEDTMLVSDLFKDAGGVQMFEKVFGAIVSNHGEKIAFPQSDVSIHVSPSGSAVAIFPNGEQLEAKSLHNWAARDEENKFGPAVDIISPLRNDGTFEMFEVREGKVTHKVVGPMPSDQGEFFAKKVARKLPRSVSKHENPSSESRRSKNGRELMTEERRKMIQVGEKVATAKGEEVLQKVQEFIKSVGQISDEETIAFEDTIKPKFEGIIRSQWE